MTYYSCIIVTTCLTLGALCVLVHDNGRFTAQNRKIYYRTYVIAMFAALCEWTGVALSGNALLPAGVLQAVKCADYILTPMVGGLLILQLHGRSALLKPVMAILAVNALFQIISAFTGWTVVIDPGNTYHHGPLYPLYMAMYIGVFGLTLAEFAMYGLRFRRQNRASIYATMVLVATGVFAQEFFGGEVRTSYLCIAIGMALLYIRNAEFSHVERDDEVQELDYRLMMSQIAPHFLFNCLGTIREIYRENLEEGDRAITSFSRYLRYNIDSVSREKPIEFSEELGHVKRYLDLQQLRFGDALVVSFDVADVEFCLPALTLQPLVENAVTHGVRKIQGRPGHVAIRAIEQDGRYEVSVTDDGPGFDASATPPDDRSHVGLRSVRERLRLVGGELVVDSAPRRGTTVTMTLPKGA